MHDQSKIFGDTFWKLWVSVNPPKVMWGPPIFYLYFKSFLFVFIVKQKQTKSLTKIRFYYIFFVCIFKIWWKSIFVGGKFWKFWWFIQEPSLQAVLGPTQIWAASVQPFWCLLDTNKHPSKVQIYRVSQRNSSNIFFSLTMASSHHLSLIFCGWPCNLHPWSASFRLS